MRALLVRMSYGLKREGFLPSLICFWLFLDKQHPPIF